MEAWLGAYCHYSLPGNLHYDLEDLNISGKITFEVQPVNCAGVGPNATTYWTYTPPTPQGTKGGGRREEGAQTCFVLLHAR